MQEEEKSIIMESSFLRDFSEDPFESLYKKCTLEWKEQECNSKNPIKQVCVDTECQKPIFLCINQKCQECYKNHIICKKVLLVAFAELLKALSLYQKSFLKKLYMIEVDVVKKMDQSQNELTDRIVKGSMDPESVNTLEIVTGKKIIEKFYGKKADELYTKLKSKSKEVNRNQDELSQMYEKISHQMIEQNIKLKNKIFDCFLNGTRPSNLPGVVEQPYFIDSPLVKLCLNELYMNTPEFYKNKTYNNFGYWEFSDEKKKAFDKEQMNYLKANLYNPRSANLLFRASQNNFDVNKFHDKCDNQAQTLTIIRTQYRKTIFAFAGAAAWNKGNANVNDTSNRACIIWLHPRIKIPCTSYGSAIHSQAGHGPWFGNNDVWVHSNGSLYTSFPTHYNNGYTNGQPAYAAMIGHPTTNNCKILDYEVYQLIF